MPTAPEEMTLKVIAHIHTAFPTKFGIPRQSGLVDELRGEVIVENVPPQPMKVLRASGIERIATLEDERSLVHES